jgi:hypothetical protein
VHTPTARHQPATIRRQEPFSRVSSSTALLSSSALATSSHQRTMMRAGKSFQPEWAQAQSFWARVQSAELAKMQICTKIPIRPFLMTKSFLPLISAVEHAGFVILVVSCSRGTLERGRGMFLHGSQTLMVLYKAIASSP